MILQTIVRLHGETHANVVCTNTEMSIKSWLDELTAFSIVVRSVCLINTFVQRYLAGMTGFLEKVKKYKFRATPARF